MTAIDKTTVITGERNTRLYQMLAQKHALKLEIETGLRFSSKRSISAIIRQRYGLKSRKKTQLYAEFQAYIDEYAGIQR